MKYIVWFKEDGKWVEQGDGPLTQKQADHIVSELRRECGGIYKILPVGQEPPVKEKLYEELSLGELRALRQNAIESGDLKRAFQIASQIDRARGFYK